MASSISAGTEAPGGHVGFPPFQKDTFASQLVWLSLAFILLYILVAKVVLPRIGSILADRKKRIADDLASAEYLKRQSDAAITAYDRSIGDARHQALMITNERRRQEAVAAQKGRLVLSSQLDLRLDESDKRIALAKTAAMTNIDKIVMDGAAAIVERLLGAKAAASTVSNVHKRIA